MTAILRRELGAYFHSPIGYIYLAVFYIFAGFYYFFGSLLSNTTDMTPVFASMFTIVLFLIPILTMRLLSEDIKHRTDQALLTAPISLTGLVLGKFLAAVCMFLLSLSVTVVYAAIIAIYATPNWALIFSNILALLLLGSALISIGMFISSLTENQIVAAVGGFFASLFLIVMDAMGNVFQNELLVKAIYSLSFYNRYSSFTIGVFDLSNVVYFLSVCALFNFLTIRVLEKRRWG